LIINIKKNLDLFYNNFIILDENQDSKSSFAFFLYSGITLFLFTIFLIYSGYFEIGLLSDDYLNFAGAQNSTLGQKFSSSIPYINNLHFRPVYYISINFGIWVNQILNMPADNFVIFRIENLIYFYIFVLLVSYLFYKFTENTWYSLTLLLLCLIYPNNLNDICWTVGKNDILCGILLFASLITTFNYSIKQSRSSLYLTGFFFSLALMTKETSIILPAVTMIIFYSAFNREKLSNIKNLIFLEFFLLIIYFLYRVYMLGVQPAEVVTKFQKPGLFTSAGVVFKSVISLIMPFDYLSIQEYLKNYNLVFTVYAILIFIFLVSVIFIFVRKYKFNYLITLFILLIVTVSPNLIAGYFRPQLILIPFSFFSFMLLYFAMKMSVNVKFYLTGIVLILLLWCKISFNLIQDWKTAYVTSQTVSESLIKLNMDPGKRNIILGLPSRFQQAVISDYIMGPYNYKKYGGFRITESVTDLILTGSLDNTSLDSEISLAKLSDNEYEILTTGSTQYFMILDESGSKYKDKDIYVRLSNRNNFNKPTMLRVRVTGNAADVYVYSKEGYSKILDNTITESTDN
jgi:hypothetical protein